MVNMLVDLLIHYRQEVTTHMSPPKSGHSVRRSF